MKKFVFLLLLGLFQIGCLERWVFKDEELRFYARCVYNKEYYVFTFSWNLDNEDNCLFYNSYRYDLVPCFVKNYKIQLPYDPKGKKFIFRKEDKELLNFFYNRQFCKEESKK